MNKSIILLLIMLLLSLTFSPRRLLAQDTSLAIETLCSFGEAFLKEKRYVEAKHELEKCLMLNPQHKKAKELLQLCQREGLIQLSLNLEEAKKSKKQEPEALVKIPSKKEKSLAPPIEKGAWALKQGAWYLKQGEFYGELYTKYYWHNHKFDDNGKKKRWDYDGKGDEIGTELKLEYGLTDRYTLLLYTVAKEMHWKDSFKSCTKKGFVEIWPGIKYLLFIDPFISYLRLRAKFPLHYSEEAVPALGTHQIDTEIKLCTAQSWPNLGGYTKFELGFKGRNEEPTNEIIYFSQLGYNVAENLIMELSLDGQEGLAQTGGVDEDWIKYTAGPIVKVGLLNIKFGFGHTFAGKNTSAAKEVYLTVYAWW